MAAAAAPGPEPISSDPRAVRPPVRSAPGVSTAPRPRLQQARAPLGRRRRPRLSRDTACTGRARAVPLRPAPEEDPDMAAAAAAIVVAVQGIGGG